VLPNLKDLTLSVRLKLSPSSVEGEGLLRVSLQMSARKEKDKRNGNCEKRGKKRKKNSKNSILPVTFF